MKKFIMVNVTFEGQDVYTGRRSITNVVPTIIPTDSIETIETFYNGYHYERGDVTADARLKMKDMREEDIGGCRIFYVTKEGWKRKITVLESISCIYAKIEEK